MKTRNERRVGERERVGGMERERERVGRRERDGCVCSLFFFVCCVRWKAATPIVRLCFDVI